MAKVLITERGLKVGDVIDWDPETKCIYIFDPKLGGSSDMRWENGDDKKFLKDSNRSNFTQMTEMIAETHGLGIEPYDKHCGATCDHIAFRFINRKKK